MPRRDASDCRPESGSDADLGARSARSAFTTLCGQAARVAIGLAGTVVLARLLTPADFGLVAMVAAALVLVSEARDLGLCLAAVRSPRLDDSQRSSLFWVGLATSFGLWLAIAALAPLLAELYDEPRVTPVALALGAGFAAGGAAAQHRALLMRRLAFQRLVLAEVLAALLGTVLGIAAALRGAGYAALVVAPVASEVAGTLLVFAFCPWRPGLPRRGSGVRRLVGFGAQLTFANAVPLAVRRLDRVLIGAVWGAAPLGLYGRAHQLVTLPIQQLHAPVSRVAVPALVRLRGDPERLRRVYLKALRILTLLGLPLLGCVAALSRELVVLVLGEAWIGAAPLLAVLAVAAAAQLVAQTAGWLLLVLGPGRRLVGWGVASSAVHAAAFALGLPFGALGVAVAHTLALVALRIPHFRLALLGTGISLREVWGAIWPSALLACGVMAAALAARAGLAERELALRSAAALAAAALCWGTALAFWPRARAALTELAGLVRHLAPRSPRAGLVGGAP